MTDLPLWQFIQAINFFKALQVIFDFRENFWIFSDAHLLFPCHIFPFHPSSFSAKRSLAYVHMYDIFINDRY
jgi:hypothetical protein